MMSAEHVVVESIDLAVGNRMMFSPRHTCTTAFLYLGALALTTEGSWGAREQLRSRRQGREPGSGMW